MAKFNLFKFMQEVRSETEKVTWPTRRETMITTAMVFIMVALTAAFFFVADQMMRFLVTCVLDFNSCRATLQSNPILVLIIGAVLGLVGYFGWSINKGRGR
jgi:preprotein translocase subunit SecE